MTPKRLGEYLEEWSGTFVDGRMQGRWVSRVARYDICQVWEFHNGESVSFPQPC